MARVAGLAAFLLRFWQKALMHGRIFGSAGPLLWERFLAVLLVLSDGFFQSFLGTLVHDGIVPSCTKSQKATIVTVPLGTKSF